ncbi:MAG: 3-deoxy-8-phosphooctulonate synthase [Gammaproteobacteria bacterium]
MNKVRIKNFSVGKGEKLCLIAGPCLLESADLGKRVAEHMVKLSEKLGFNYVFKSSYEKDNRGAASNHRGLGIDEGLKAHQAIGKEFNIPLLSDVHRESDCAVAAEVLDVLQIPAYLCQQTSLLVAAGETGKVVNVKKGQFLAPEDMASAIDKLESVNNKNILLCERGASFGYHRLVSDMRSIPIMSGLGYPVIFDAGHIVRIYGISSKDPRGGEPQFIPALSRAGMAAGAHGLFVETHPNPMEGLCDAASMYKLDEMEGLLSKAVQIHDMVQSWDIS